MPFPAPGYQVPPPRPGAKSKAKFVILGVVVLAVIAGAAVVIHGSAGTPAAQPDPGISSLLNQLNSQPTAAPTVAPTAESEAATCVSSLTACLVPAPSGSSPVDDAWGKGPSSESVAQYVDHFYTADDSAAKERTTARLGASGETAIAKQNYRLSNGELVDDALLSFSTDNGAQSWYDRDLNSESGTEISIPGAPAGVQGYTRPADSSGVGWTVVYGYSDSTVMEIWVEKKDKADTADASTLVVAQMAAVAGQASERTVPLVPSPSVAPFSPTNDGSAACAAGTIGSCLVPSPAGSQPWTGKPYYTQTDVTLQQYVDQNWAQADQATTIQSLTDAGVEKVAHRDWVTTADLQTDVTVLRFTTAAEAQIRDEVFQGVLSAEPGQAFDISGVSAQGVIRPMEADGDVDVEICGHSGPYEIVMHFYAPANADVADAMQLFEQEYNLLPAS